MVKPQILLIIILLAANAKEIESQLCTELTSASEDEIEVLPGLGKAPNFKHYSGYLKSSDKHFLHYWFVTSQNDPCRDPLVFWFNGGPGCSSLGGLLEELGPYLVNPDGRTLRKNPNSWNKNASVVFIESPVGVGFSYSADEEQVMSGDESTAQGNYEAVKQFFLKFPLFRPNRVFITGESYAGIYVPTLVAKIVDGQADFPINLEGMAIGNGHLHTSMNYDTMARFAYFHGLLGEEAWKELENECCGGCADTCDFGSLYGECRKRVTNIIALVWRGGLNVYDIYRDCDHGPNSKRMKAIRKGIFKSANKSDPWNVMEENLDAKKNELTGHSLRSVTPCLFDETSAKYLNSPKVRKALHIPENVPKWEECSESVFSSFVRKYHDLSPFVLKAIEAKVRVLLYFGDTDIVCNFLQGQRFSAQLGLSTFIEKKPWHFEGQIAGFKTEYARGLTFLTFRGVGHMVPQWLPAESEYAIRQFLFNQKI